MVDLSVAAKAAWLTDPVFVTLAKSLYGSDVDLADIQKDVFGKDDPGSADVSVKRGVFGRKKSKDPVEVDEEEKKAFGKSLSIAVQHGVLDQAEAADAVMIFAKDWASYDAERQRHKGYKSGGAPPLKNRNDRIRYHMDVISRASRRQKVGGAVAGVGAIAGAAGIATHNLPLAAAGGVAAVGGGLLASRNRKNASPHKGAITTMKNNDFHKAVVDHHIAQNFGHLSDSRQKDMKKGIMSGGTHVLNAVVQSHRSQYPRAHKDIKQAIDNHYNNPVPQQQSVEPKPQTNWRKGKKTVMSEDDIAHMEHSFAGVGKSADEHEVTWEGEFSKVDEDKRQVFGWASVTEVDGKPVVDLQGDYIHPTEMERAAYDYVLKSRKGGDMHSRVDADGNLIEKADHPLHVSDMIESMVFTPEKVAKLGLPEGSLPTGWWVGFKVNDQPTWDLVKSGERKGFSIHGMGARMEKRLEEIDPKSAIVGKAYSVSADTAEFKANLETISEVTGDEFFKHLAHGIYVAQPPSNTTRDEVVGAGLGASLGSHVGNLASGLAGKDGAAGKVIQGGAAVAGAVAGGVAGHFAESHRGPAKLVRPQIVEAQVPRSGRVSMRYGGVSKDVSTANRSGSLAHRQDFYTKQALEKATAELAPQVAQHIQNMQQQKWQQSQMEQQMLMQQAAGGQQAVNPQQQNWQTMQQQSQLNGAPMGPYDNADQSSLTGGIVPKQEPQRTSL